MRLTIKTKLLCSFGGVLALLGTAGYFGISSLQQSNAMMAEFAARPFVQVGAAKDTQSAIQVIRRTLRTALTTADPTLLAPIRAAYDNAWKTIGESIDRLAVGSGEDAQKRMADSRQMLADLKQLSDENWTLAANADFTLPETSLKMMRAPEVKLVGTVDSLFALLGNETGDSAAKARLALQNILLWSAEAQIATLATVNYSTDDDIRAASDRLNALNDRITSKIGDIAVLSPRLAPALDTARADWNALYRTMRPQADIGLNNWMNRATALLTGKQNPLADKVSARLDDLSKSASEAAGAFVASAQSSYESTRNMLIALVLGAIALGAGAALWMSLSISRGLQKAVKLADDIGAGDLTQRVEVKTQDEIGDLQRAMNTMTERLREIVTDVVASSEQVASGSIQSAATAEALGQGASEQAATTEQLGQGASEQAATTERLGQGASEQAAATEQASSAMEEMAANIRQNAENATTTEKIAAQASMNAEKSGAAVRNAVDAMRTIADKIRIVQEIARQTDLLALNAAIEAARAGSHGKGFAVVASEVRKLAERSQLAATEIGELSTSTLHISEEAGKMLEQLVPDIQRTSELVGEISAACREQNAGAEQINQAIQQLDQVTQQTNASVQELDQVTQQNVAAVQQLDQVTQQNAAAANQMAATAEQLSAEAGRLRDRVAFFRLGEEAPLRAAPAPRTSLPTGDVRSLQARVGGFAAVRPAPKAFAPKKPGAQLPAQKPVAKGGFALDLTSDDTENGFEKMSA